MFILADASPPTYLPPLPLPPPHDCTPSRAPSHPLSRARVVSYPLPGHSFSLSLFLHLPSPLSLLPAGRRFPSGIRVLAPRSLPISLPSQRRAITPSSLKRLTRVPRRRFRCYSERDRLFSVYFANFAYKHARSRSTSVIKEYCVSWMIKKRKDIKTIITSYVTENDVGNN